MAETKQEVVQTETQHHEHEPRRRENVVLDFEDPHRAALEDNPDKPEKLTWSTILAVIFLGMSFIGPISFGFILITGILVPVGLALGDTENIVWIPGAWSVASSVSFSIAGSLSDIFGRRWITVSGQVFSLIGFIVAATANTTKTVVAGSTLIGFGCGIIFVAYAGIPELLPNKWRGAGLGWTEFCMTVPWATGGVIFANLFVEHASWRWCYYPAIIYGAVSMIGTLAFYFPPSRPQMDYQKTRWQEIKELDYIGICLYSGGLTVFLVGLTWAGTPAHPWKSASVVAPIVIGVLTFIGCFAYDFTLAKNPFFPYSLFAKVREFTILLLLVFVSGMIFYSMAGLLPQGSLYMFTNDPIQIGLIALPNGCAQLLGGVLVPALSHRIKHLKIQIIVALIIQTLFTALYSTIIPHNKHAWMAFQFFGQSCFAAVTLLCYVIAGLHVPWKELGVASGLIGTFRSGGGSIGNAIFSTILHGVVGGQIGPRVSKAVLELGFPADQLEKFIPAVIESATAGIPTAYDGITGATPAIQAAGLAAFREAYAYAFRRVFWSTIPFGILAIIAAFFINDPSEYLTNHTAIHMEKDRLTGETHVLGKASDSDITDTDGDDAEKRV